MTFTSAFTKRASEAMTRHNDGSEFKTQEGNPSVGSPSAGGMSPSGLEIYEPVDRAAVGGGPPSRKQRQRMLLFPKIGTEVAQVAALPGSGGDVAEAVSEQLKYETSGDFRPERVGGGWLPGGRKRRRK